MHLPKTDYWENDLVALFLLEPQHVSDAYVGWLNDPEINRFLESRFASHDRSSTEAFVRSMCDSPKDLMLGMHDKRLNRHVGNIKLGPIDHRHGLGEIGLMIGDRAAWGKGVATTAIAIICEIGFRQLGLRKLTAGCYASNLGSKIAFEKAGFMVEGIRRSHFLLDGDGEDLILLAQFSKGAANQNEPVQRKRDAQF